MVSLLLENDLPHNLVMIRAPAFSRGQQLQSTSTGTQTAVDDGATVIRSILVPRKPAYGMCSRASILCILLIVIKLVSLDS